MGTGSAKIYDTFLRKASRVRWPSTRIRKLTPAIGAMNSGRVRGIGVTATSAGTTPTTSGAECTYLTQVPISAEAGMKKEKTATKAAKKKRGEEMEKKDCGGRQMATKKK